MAHQLSASGLGQKRKGVWKRCRQCNTNFYSIPSVATQWRRGKFCSDECSRLFHRAVLVVLSCRQCKRKFMRSEPEHRHKTTRRGDRRQFCSRRCFAAHNRGPDNPLRWHWPRRVKYPKATTDWIVLSRQIRKEAKGRCQACGNIGRRLNVDHVVPIRAVLQIEGANPNLRENLLVVCCVCHAPKTVAERHLANGNLLSFEAELNKIGYDPQTVRTALSLYFSDAAGVRGRA
jgi:hypothetical protein